jgi:ribosomal protein S13
MIKVFAYKQVMFEINLEIRSALQQIFGIGQHKALCICARIGLSFPFSMGNLNNYYFMLLSFILDFFT